MANKSFVALKHPKSLPLMREVAKPWVLTEGEIKKNILEDLFPSHS